MYTTYLLTVITKLRLLFPGTAAYIYMHSNSVLSRNNEKIILQIVRQLVVCFIKEKKTRFDYKCILMDNKNELSILRC